MQLLTTMNAGLLDQTQKFCGAKLNESKSMLTMLAPTGCQEKHIARVVGFPRRRADAHDAGPLGPEKACSQQQAVFVLSAAAIVLIYLPVLKRHQQCKLKLTMFVKWSDGKHQTMGC